MVDGVLQRDEVDRLGADVDAAAGLDGCRLERQVRMRDELHVVHGRDPGGLDGGGAVDAVMGRAGEAPPLALLRIGLVVGRVLPGVGQDIPQVREQLDAALGIGVGGGGVDVPGLGLDLDPAARSERAGNHGLVVGAVDGGLAAPAEPVAALGGRIGLRLVLGGRERHRAARGDGGVLARLDVRGLDGGIAARVDDDVAAGRERGLHMGGGEVIGVPDGGDLLRLDVGAAARVDGQIAARGGNLAAHIVDVLGRVERDAVRGGDAGLLGRHIGMGAGGRKPVRPGHEKARDLAAAAAAASTGKAPPAAHAQDLNRLALALSLARIRHPEQGGDRLRQDELAVAGDERHVLDGLGVDGDVLALHHARQVLEIPCRIDGDGAACRNRALEVHHRAGLGRDRNPAARIDAGGGLGHAGGRGARSLAGEAQPVAAARSSLRLGLRLKRRDRHLALGVERHILARLHIRRPQRGVATRIDGDAAACINRGLHNVAARGPGLWR